MNHEQSGVNRYKASEELLASVKASIDKHEQTFLLIPADAPIPELRAYRAAGMAQVEVGRKWYASIEAGDKAEILRIDQEVHRAANDSEEAGRALDHAMTRLEHAMTADHCGYCGYYTIDVEGDRWECVGCHANGRKDEAKRAAQP